jgi:NAD(P)-dependent dehydrogenase (short-subunit alcohol dehydrogenase family)
MEITNKLVVVAGSSNGAGKAVAELLAAAGASVIIADTHLINAEIVVQQLMDKFKTDAAAVSPNIKEIRALLESRFRTDDKIKNVDIWVIV